MKRKNGRLADHPTRRQMGISLEAVVKRQRRRGKSFRILGGLFFAIGLLATLFVLSGIGLHWVARQAVFENSKYKLVHIEVETSGRLRRDQVLEWAEIPSQTNLVLLNIREIRERLMSQSEIGEAHVRKILPNRLAIKVSERRPMARVVTNVIVGQGRALMYAVDRQGIVMSPRPGEDFMHLPEITGANLIDVVQGEPVRSDAIMNAIELLAAIEQSPLRSRIGRPRVDVSDDTVLRLSTSVTGWITFAKSPAIFDQQLERLGKILDYAEKNSKKIQSADLTVVRNVPAVLVSKR